MKLQKLTTHYCQLQDRLCIDGQTLTGEVVSLWLTCRLMRHLLPTLIHLITPTPDVEGNVTTMAQWALTSALAQKKQEQAVKRPEKPVASDTYTAPSNDYLVITIEITSVPFLAVLVFSTATNKQVASIELARDHLRQWVAIVYGLWLNTGWPADKWPAWIKNTEAAVTSGNVVLH